MAKKVNQQVIPLYSSDSESGSESSRVESPSSCGEMQPTSLENDMGVHACDAVFRQQESVVEPGGQKRARVGSLDFKRVGKRLWKQQL